MNICDLWVLNEKTHKHILGGSYEGTMHITSIDIHSFISDVFPFTELLKYLDPFTLNTEK